MLNQLEMEGYSYRTSSRFGSRVKVVIDHGLVTIIGPRIEVIPYRLWIGVQAVLLSLAFLALLAAVIFSSWLYLGLCVVCLVCHGCAGGFGAGCLWELENLIEFGANIPGKSVCFQLNQIKRIRIGRGWARKGMWLLLLPYIVFINKMTEGYCVSFEAPDGERGGEGVYALHMRSKEDARQLAKYLDQKSLQLEGKEGGR